MREASRSSEWRAYRAALVVGDAVILAVSAVAASVACGELGCHTPLDDPSLLLAGPIVLVAVLALFAWRGAYAPARLLGGPDEYLAVVGAGSSSFVAGAAASFLLGADAAWRAWLVILWPTATVGLVLGRYALRRAAYRLRRRGHFQRRVLVIGASEEGLAIARQLHAPEASGLTVVGFLDDYLPLDTPVPIDGVSTTVRGLPREAAEVAARERADLVVIVPTALTWESQSAVLELYGADERLPEVRVAPTAYDVSAVGVEPAPLNYVPLVRLRPSRSGRSEVAFRAALDLVLASLVLVAVAPLFAAVALRAWLAGVRPILERRTVVGEFGRPFELRLLARGATDRVLVRGWLSLLDVIRGELALVGPRPMQRGEVARLDRRARLVLGMKPGLTGPWRLLREDATGEERLLADLWWVRNWTVGRHLFVLFKAARVALLSRSGGVARWEARAAAARVADPAARTIDAPVG